MAKEWEHFAFRRHRPIVHQVLLLFSQTVTPKWTMGLCRLGQAWAGLDTAWRGEARPGGARRGMGKARYFGGIAEAVAEAKLLREKEIAERD